MKNLFYRFASNLTRAYIHADANVIKERGGALYKKLVLVFAAAPLTLPFMSGPAYSLGGGTFPFRGTGSFSYDCASVNPVGSDFTFDAGAGTFRANVGNMTCIFTLQNGNTVTVPYNLDVTYHNVIIQSNGSTTAVTAVCPTATYTGTFQVATGGSCQGSPADCAAWSGQFGPPVGEFTFLNPWVGQNANNAKKTCDALFKLDTEQGLGLDVLATYSESRVPGQVDATDPIFRFCATPTDPSTGRPEPCSETLGSGPNKFLYVRGASGTAEIRIIGDANAVNKWNITTSQNGNYNVKYNKTPELTPSNLVDIKVEGVPTTGCSTATDSIQCSFPGAVLGPILRPRVVNGQVSVTGTAQTNGGTAVIFFFTAQASNN